MDNQQPSSPAFQSHQSFKRQVVQKSIDESLDDKAALEEWNANLEKIRQLASKKVAKNVA